jgi:hypothetical protein
MVAMFVNEYKSPLVGSPCQRQCELLPSLGVCRPLAFHILIFSSEIPPPNEVKLGRSGFRGEDFLKINQSETRIACGGDVC